MTREELERAIEETKREIYQLKEKIDLAADRRNKKRMQVMLMELQYLQLWHIEQLERHPD